MPYNTEYFKYGIGAAGLNYDANISNMHPSCVLPYSINFNVLKNSLRSRGGTKIILDSPENSPISSMYQVSNTSNEGGILHTNDNGKIYWNNSLLHSDVSSIRKATYVNWNGNIIVNWGLNTPQIWDRSSVSTIDFPSEHMSPDWVADNIYPKVMKLYGKRTSVRAWAIGEGLRKNTIYYSNLNNGITSSPDFSVSNGGFFFISTRNNEPLTAIINFGDRLIVFSASQSFVIDDSSSSTSDWGYVEAQWKGGTISQNTVVATENDILAMTEDGTIYSVTAVTEYGDYKISSITEQASIDDYFKDYINKSQLNNIHMLYDPYLRCIKIFCSSSVSTKNDMAFVYFIDKTPETGWGPVHNNILYNSGYDANCSAVVLSEHNTYIIITGDYNGDIWELETNTIQDGNNIFEMSLTTPIISVNNPRITKRFKRGFLELSCNSPINVSIRMKTDLNSKHKLVYHSISNPNNVFDEAKWDIAKFAGGRPIQRMRYHINLIGVGLQQTFIFSPYSIDKLSQYDVSKWDEATFPRDNITYNQFEVISNMLDITPIASRLKI